MDNGRNFSGGRVNGRLLPEGIPLMLMLLRHMLSILLMPFMVVVGVPF